MVLSIPLFVFILHCVRCFLDILHHLPVFWIFFRFFFNVIAAVLEKQTMMGEICYICMAGWSGGWFGGFCRYVLPSFCPAAFLQSPRSVAIGRQTGSVQELILLSADYKEILSKIALCLQLCMLGFCRNVHWNNEADFVKISVGGWLFECRNRTSCGTPATFTCSSASHGKCSFLLMFCCSQYKMTCSMLEDSYPQHTPDHMKFYSKKYYRCWMT